MEESPSWNHDYLNQVQLPFDDFNRPSQLHKQPNRGVCSLTIVQPRIPTRRGFLPRTSKYFTSHPEGCFPPLPSQVPTQPGILFFHCFLCLRYLSLVPCALVTCHLILVPWSPLTCALVNCNLWWQGLHLEHLHNQRNPQPWVHEIPGDPSLKHSIRLKWRPWKVFHVGHRWTNAFGEN